MVTGSWQATSRETMLMRSIPEGGGTPLEKGWDAMAAILIVEEDGVLAQQMARTLRQAGHFPILASDARSALRGAEERPDVILLDLELPDLQGEDLLARLQSPPGTARIPVLAITWRREANAQLREKGGVADVLLKPVSGVQLREAVDNVFAIHWHPTAEALRLDQKRQRELILRLIAHAPDPLVFHISRRICADRTSARSSHHGETLSWAEIADWGRREGLLDAEQASLLRRMSGPTASRAPQDAA
jgi:CheY-like chemotaxis protein